MIVNGVKTCTTTRSALKALREAGKDATFRDFRETPPTPAEIDRWSQAFGSALLNRASTTWRGLSHEERQGDPKALMLRHPNLIKRPLIEDGARRSIGWKDDARALWLG